MIVNARAIARAAELVHDGFTKFKFSKIADELENAMFKRLWAPEQEFFVRISHGFSPPTLLWHEYKAAVDEF